MFNLIAIVYLYIIIQMSLVWLIYRYLKNPSVVDVSWSLGLMIAGLIYLWQPPLNHRLLYISMLLIAWALRLAGFLWYTRIRKGHVDKRYTKLSSGWKMAPSLGFFLNFQLQGFFILILSIVFLFASTNSPLTFSIIDYIGALLVVMGLIGETIADYQLFQFKQRNKNKVCQVGLWYYSRHPNYFFEFTIWCGFALFGFQHALGWLSVVSPLWLYIIFTKMTIPITEQSSIDSKGQAYESYQRSTSVFIPWFKKPTTAA